MAIEWKACFAQAARDFCENTSLHGFQYLVEDKRSKIEKLAWFLVLSASIIIAVYLFYLMSIEFARTPTVITLETNNNPISVVEFPGVAICDVNRISRRAAEQLAARKYRSLNISLANLTDLIQYLGVLHDWSITNIQKVVELDRLLEKKKDALSKNGAEIRKVIRELTPPCNKTLVKCFWRGEEISCDYNFHMRRTMIGYCCTFNYAMQTNGLGKHLLDRVKQKVRNSTYLRFAGYEMGLTVLVHSDVNDYYYPLLETAGVRVFTFYPYDYPDMYSGGLSETLVALNKEVFMKIEASQVYAVDALESYDVEARQCILDSDPDDYSKQGYFFDNTRYSVSNCISECKMKSIVALCDCVPFFMPVQDQSYYADQTCTLSDTTCLDKYADKWMTLYPTMDDRNPDLAFEVDNSVSCEKCYPACTYTNYDVSSDYATLVDTGKPMFNGYDPRSHSLIHVYYDTENTVKYKTDLYYYWFDQLSNFGGLCGLFLGFSVISVVEFAYFFTVHYLKLLKKSWKKNRVEQE